MKNGSMGETQKGGGLFFVSGSGTTRTCGIFVSHDFFDHQMQEEKSEP